MPITGSTAFEVHNRRSSGRTFSQNNDFFGNDVALRSLALIRHGALTQQFEFDADVLSKYVAQHTLHNRQLAKLSSHDRMYHAGSGKENTPARHMLQGSGAGQPHQL